MKDLMEHLFSIAAAHTTVATAASGIVLCAAYLFVLSQRDLSRAVIPLISAFTVAVIGLFFALCLSAPALAPLAIPVVLIGALLLSGIVTLLFSRSRRSGEMDRSFYRLVENLSDGLRIVKEGRTVYVNRRFCELTGYTREELVGTVDNIVFAEESLPVVAEQLKLRRLGKKGSYEVRLKRKDGSLVPAIVSAQPLFDSRGNWVGSCGVFTDITARIEAEEQVRESELRFKDFAESASDRFWEMDDQLRFTFVNGNPQSSAPERARIIGRTRWDKAGANPDRDEHWRRHRQDLLEHRPFRGFRYSEIDSAGRIRFWKVSGKPVFDRNGKFVGYRGTSQELTGEVLAQQQALEAQQTLLNALDTISEGFAIFDPSDRLVLCNRRCAEIFPEVADLLQPGATFESIYLAALRRGMIEHREELEVKLRERLIAREASSHRTVQQLSGNRWVQITERRTTDGGMVAVWTDITDLKRGEQQLLHAQKMEAVGQLTGGIAHDFNNLLAVILGSLELLQDRLGHSTPGNRLLSRALTATRRGAALTQRLLAFSRKQALQPQPTDTRKLVWGMRDILATSLGESIAIQLDFPDDLPPALVDPCQLETALLNLVLNSRDAMPEGGELLISGRSREIRREDESGEMNGAPPGIYLSLTVKDTGCGMPPQVRDRIFEPFFTTKEVGKGSGLGLSMVYGFVKQSGGHISVDSAPGRGTAFELLIPRALHRQTSVDADGLAEPISAAAGERVLVVEDDNAVRELIVSILSDLGYEVLEAADGPSALRQLALARKVDLLLTDLVLPSGMSGIELAAEGLRRYPSMQTLLMSGYMEHLMDDWIKSAQPILRKPFRRAELARKVREVLGGEKTPALELVRTGSTSAADTPVSHTTELTLPLIRRAAAEE